MSLRVCMVGGIFGRTDEYRQKHKYTPESILADGLRARGVHVDKMSHQLFRPSDSYDVVHVHHLAWGAVRSAATPGRPFFVFTVHGPYFTDGSFRLHERPLTSRAAIRYVLARCDAVVALSHREAGFLRRMRARAESIHVIPNGIPSDIFRPANDPGNGEAPRGHILYVGSLAAFKGIDLLLRATQQINRRHPVDLTLVYQYDGLEKEYRTLAHDLGIAERVRFAGFLSGDDVAVEYRRADVTVLPSFSEALPSVISESLLSGTPVVATDVGGIREQINTYGAVVPAGDLPLLTEAIERTLEARSSYRDRRQEMRAYAVGAFSIDRMVEAHLRLYESLLCDGKSPRRTGSMADALVRTALNFMY